MADTQSLISLKEEEEREIQGTEEENEDGSEEESEEEREEEEEEEKPLSKVRKSLSSITIPDGSSFEAELRSQSCWQSETLAVPSSMILSPENDHDSDCRSFSQLLAGAMASPVAVLSDGLDVKPSIPTGFGMGLLESPGIKVGQFAMSHQEVLASVTAQAAQVQAQKQFQAGYPSSPELSPTSHTTSMSSTLSPTPLQKIQPPVSQDNNVSMSTPDQQNSSDRKTKPANVIGKTPSSDGYNWRKYGQKQVKSTESSRSYYKCTYSDCHAKKKIERCDHSGHVTEIIYKGRHNHDPPRKIRSTKARRFVSSAGPVGGSETVNLPIRKLNSDPTTSRKEPRQVTLPTPEKKRHSSSGSDWDVVIKAEEEHSDEPNPKRRIKDNTVAYSVPLLKTVKEPKIIVQAAGDVGISGDGYRWRKYGQKMVKGNPNPRSYYKCTSAGCPVRKHVERATDDTTTILITYEGKHDHDMPVPKKRHGPPSTALLIAAAAAMNNAQLNKCEAASTQWPVDTEGELAGEKAMELGGEKALESARTLLSIGIELKPC